MTETVTREGAEQFMQECGLTLPRARFVLLDADAAGHAWVTISGAYAVRAAYGQPGCYVVRRPWGSEVR